jgi:LysR family hydrogen peroxide-inducible transcriptional activator
MEMQHIRYFLALCEEQNFTRAARRCGVAQPSLTRAIKRLEKELGGRLFERSRKSTEMTALGRAMRPHFTDIERSAAAARRDAARFLGARPTKSFREPERTSVRKAATVAAV